MRSSNLQQALEFIITDPSGGASIITFDGHVDSISDSLSPSWTTVQQAGMPEGKKLYSAFQRQVNLNFYVIAEDGATHESNRIKLQSLATAAYPYKLEGFGYNGHYVTINFGNVFKGTGVITTLSYDWTSDYSWGPDKMPMITTVNLNLDVIADKNGRKPYQGHEDF